MGKPLIQLPTKDRSGETHHAWTLLRVAEGRRYATKTTGQKTIVWIYECRCTCGSIHKVSWTDIRRGKSTRCQDCNIKNSILNAQKGIQNFGSANPNYRGVGVIPGLLSTVASLDRTDPAQGYVVGNITWISKTINLVKMNFSHETFLSVCRMVSTTHSLTSK